MAILIKNINSPDLVYPLPAARPNSYSSNTSLTQHCYSIKKRFLVPSWWVRGYMLRYQNSEKSHFYEKNLTAQELLPPDLTPKHFLLIASLWMELVRKLVADGGESHFIEIDLHRFLRGTSADLSEQLSVVESYWATPIRLIKSEQKSIGRKSKKQATLESEASFNFVKQSRVEIHSTGPCLCVELNVSLEDFCFGRLGITTKNKSFYPEYDDFVSLNPDVLRVFSTGKSPKKLCSYLAIEYGKRFFPLPKLEKTQWRGGIVDTKELYSFHKDLMTKTKALYDHGIFGWSNEAPPIKISELRAHLEQQNGARQLWANSVHMMYLSEQAISARQAEAQLSIQPKTETIYTGVHQKPVSETKKIQLTICQSKAIPSTLFQEQSNTLKFVQIPKDKVEEKIELKAEPRITKAAPMPTTAAKPSPVVKTSPVSKPSTPVKSPDIDFDKEFIIKMANFYEALSDNCREAIQKTQTRMSQEQFKEYMAPLLKMRQAPRRR